MVIDNEDSTAHNFILIITDIFPFATSLCSSEGGKQLMSPYIKLLLIPLGLLYITRNSWLNFPQSIPYDCYEIIQSVTPLSVVLAPRLLLC